MAERVCPWWLGHLLASPIRKWWSGDPAELLRPYVRAGSRVLEPGPGMGFFTIPLAKMIGPEGKIFAVDVQAKMLEGLRKRVRKAGCLERIETRLAESEHLGTSDLKGTIDVALAFAVVHEMPKPAVFFGEVEEALKPGGSLLLAEPAGHVTPAQFENELSLAAAAGLIKVGQPKIRRCLAALLKKP